MRVHFAMVNEHVVGEGVWATWIAQGSKPPLMVKVVVGMVKSITLNEQQHH